MIQDQLNLTLIAQEAKRQSRASRWLMRTGILLLSFTFLVFLIIPSSWNFNYQAFVEGETGWHEIDDLRGDPVDIQISPRGIVWIQTRNPDALNRWDGSSWKVYEHVGTEGEQSLEYFTLDGEDVWVATDKSVAYFDGDDWQAFPDAVQDMPQDISAGLQGVFVIDCNGDLSRYYDGAWTISNVKNVLPGLESSSTYCTPSLLQTRDGSTWLEWFGIWQFDGDQWQQAKIADVTSTNGVRLAGINESGIWTSWGPHGLVWSSFDFSSWYVYDNDTLGLSAEGRIHQVIDAPGRFIAATNEGLLQSRGDAWEKYPSPQVDNSNVFRVATLPDGQLWAATQLVSNPLSTSILWLLLVVVILFIFAFFFTFIWVRRIQLRHSIEAREYLRHWMPEVAQPKSPRFTKMVYILWTALLLGLGILIGLLPALGTSGLGIFGVALVAGVIVSLVLWRRRMGQKVSIKRFILYALPIATLILWFGGLAIGLAVVPRVTGSGIFAIGFLILWTGIVMVIAVFPYYYAYKIPLGRGDYATALRRIEQLRRFQPDHINYMCFHGILLLLVQRYAESEAILRECVTRIGNNQPLLQAAVLNNLGEALTGQGRNDEAVGALESAIHMWPQLPTAFNGLAELYLEHGDNPTRALELIEFAQRYGSLNVMTQLLEPFHASITQSLRAWALAKLNRADEANQDIAAATKRMKSNIKFVQASLYYMSGRVKQALGDTLVAQEQFRQSVALDPTGIYGLRAKQILTTDFQA